MSQYNADANGWWGTDEGGKLKEAGTSHWESPNTGATNESGFTALPGGHRSTSGSYNGIGVHASFWSSTQDKSGEPWCRMLYSNYSKIFRGHDDKRHGYSVRCVK